MRTITGRFFENFGRDFLDFQNIRNRGCSLFCVVPWRGIFLFEKLCNVNILAISRFVNLRFTRIYIIIYLKNKRNADA